MEIRKLVIYLLMTAVHISIRTADVCINKGAKQGKRGIISQLPPPLGFGSYTKYFYTTEKTPILYK